ncbi:MAG: hypothetical protein KKE20_04065 [Nanoarchaeota archaeon]|nr:hypothetical protein [Nanoarchaeota archaeon]
MGLFHKDINEKLAEHLQKLKDSGMLPDDWAWHREKILELEKIDENLIGDIRELHSNRAFSIMISMIKGKDHLDMLHSELKSIIKQHSPDASLQKEEAEQVNRMVKSITEDIGRINDLIGFVMPYMHIRVPDFENNKALLSFMLKRWDEVSTMIKELETKEQRSGLGEMLWSLKGIIEEVWEFLRRDAVGIIKRCDNSYLYSYGFESVSSLINRETWDTITHGLIRLSDASGQSHANPDTFFIYIMKGRFKDLLNINNWNIFVEGSVRILNKYQGHIQLLESRINLKPEIDLEFNALLEEVRNIH